MQKEIIVLEVENSLEYEQSINSHLKIGWQILWSNIEVDSRLKYKAILVLNDGEMVSTKGLRLIADERINQLAKWSKEHDKEHKYGELTAVAAVLCLDGIDGDIIGNDMIYLGLDMWGLVERYRNNRIKQLQIAGALIAAEIDRIIEETQQ